MSVIRMPASQTRRASFSHRIMSLRDPDRLFAPIGAAGQIRMLATASQDKGALRPQRDLPRSACK